MVTPLIVSVASPVFSTVMVSVALLLTTTVPKSSEDGERSSSAVGVVGSGAVPVSDIVSVPAFVVIVSVAVWLPALDGAKATSTDCEVPGASVAVPPPLVMLYALLPVTSMLLMTRSAPPVLSIRTLSVLLFPMSTLP
jgi:hypothetical protein